MRERFQLTHHPLLAGGIHSGALLVFLRHDRLDALHELIGYSRWQKMGDDLLQAMLFSGQHEPVTGRECFRAGDFCLHSRESWFGDL
ncbi:MAG: hypothetical protein B7Z16_18235, partial [Algoriphagus sp. 32-45-6]